MKNAKRILSVLLACLMLMAAVPFAVSAAGTQDDPINAADKWFGYGVDTYLLNPTIAEGSDGTWYTLTADKAGVLVLEHSYKNVDYTITITLNGQTYEGGCVNGEPYNRPIVTAPIAVGDVATIRIVTKDQAAGTVYASMNVLAGDSDDPVKVKSNGLTVVVGAGKTLYFQDDSLNAIYATKGLLVKGDVSATTFYNVSKNTESGAVTQKSFTDTDQDGILEVTLGGSLGSAGAPAVKPGWAIENNSNKDQVYTLTIVDAAHECVWDNDEDADCNTCGAIREIAQACDHKYTDNCDADCDLCGKTRVAPHYPVGDYACNKLCCVCWADLTTADHVYSSDLDNSCNVCGEFRDVELPAEWIGASISEDVNGLACLFSLEVKGMTQKNTTAVYDKATFCGYKLKSMGAVVCNNFAETGVHPTIEDADGKHVANVSAKYLYDINAEDNIVTFAIRLVDIPEDQKDTEIFFVPYVVIEANGREEAVYITNWAYSDTYNNVAGN